MSTTVWARFQVPDDATPEQVAEALELVFRGGPDTAFAATHPRRVVDAVRTAPPHGTSIDDLRLRAADSVHVSYDYGRPVVEEGPWRPSGDALVREVRLDSDGADGSATLMVRFEPGTAIVLSALAEGPGMPRDGRRLDPLVAESEDLLRARMAAGERALHALPHASPISGWYGVAEPGMVALARDLLCDGRSTRLVALFEPGSTRISRSRHDDQNPSERTRP